MQIVFLIPPNANMFDLAGASQVFHEASENGLNVSIKFCGFEKKIKTSTGIPLGNIESYKKHHLKKGDFLFIASAQIEYMLSSKMNPSQDLINWINKCYKVGATVCSLCNGAFLLGQTGLLDGRNCTTHWKRTEQLQKKFPFAKVHENILYIEDDRIISSAGATSGVDVALHVLNKLKDDRFVYTISRELVIYNRRSGNQLQKSIYTNYRNHMHKGIHKVQDFILKNTHVKTSLPQLSEIANMSDRNFTRVFKRETGLTVNEFITSVRKEKINELIKNPDMSRSQIASECGLKSERQVSRLLN